MNSIKNSINFTKKLFYKIKQLNGINIEIDLKNYIEILEKIRSFSFENKTDSELKNIFSDFKKRFVSGESLDNLLPEVYAVTNEVVKRVLKIEPFDEQIIAGIVMHQGKLAEMKTGEGKTLAAVFPVILNALSGNPVMIMTANSYLAKRDALWMENVYKFLGFESGFINEETVKAERKKVYEGNIIYITLKEAGFDYLRDGQSYDEKDILQKPFYFAIVDEADFSLIDEARVPLVIASEEQKNDIDFYKISGIVEKLVPEKDYQFNIEGKNIYLTDDGIEKVQNDLLCDDIFHEKNSNLLSAVNVNLYAKTFLKLDVDYIVRDNAILLLDEFTGRVAINRRLPFGIQNALEARHKLPVFNEGKVQNSITIVHFIRLFPKLAAMTATAVLSSDDFSFIYNLSIVIIPPHKESVRIDLPDKVFLLKNVKQKAIIDEVVKEHRRGRPVLIGTGSVKESEEISELLFIEKIDHNVLNAKNDEEESRIIANAGALNAVTISTNMAGRGTDIKQGGIFEEQKNDVEKLGGLYIIGTTRYESRRIDEQLSGRSGRQGEQGSSVFFISLEDELVKRYNLLKLLKNMNITLNESIPIENDKINNEIKSIQSVIANKHFLIRNTLIKYSRIVEKQRKIVRDLRMSILLENENGLLQLQECLDFHKKLRPVSAEKKAFELERKMTLNHIDNFWANHLECISLLKEGLHLHLYGKRDPYYVFLKNVDKLFYDGFERMKRELTESFLSLDLNEENLKFDTAEITGSSSSLTYLLDDNSFTKLDSIVSLMKNVFKFK
jgi:preprotein translocase subunit SecA